MTLDTVFTFFGICGILAGFFGLGVMFVRTYDDIMAGKL